MKISFIIPVYNVENYLPECVESILNQGELDYEVLLVNDGSTDGSGKLCDEYAQKHHCVRVIHMDNNGAASARNTGLEHAKGKYVAFVDSDDRIAAGSVPKLMQWIDEGGADLCFLEGIKFFPDGKQIPLGDNIIRSEVRGKSKEEVCMHLASRPKFAGSACTKLFRKDFLDEHQMRFQAGRRHAEDLTLCRDCILRAQTYDALSMPYYEYRQDRAGSVTDTLGVAGFYDLCNFVAESAEILTRDREAIDTVSGCIMSFAAYEYSIVIWYYSLLKKQDKPEAMRMMKRYEWVMKFGTTTKLRATKLASHLIGLKMTSWLFKQYIKHR